MDKDKEITYRTVIPELRNMAASIMIDNGGYRERLRTIADLLEQSWYPMFVLSTTDKAVTIVPPAWPKDEVIKQQESLIESLQKDIALLKRQLYDEHTEKE